MGPLLSIKLCVILYSTTLICTDSLPSDLNLLLFILPKLDVQRTKMMGSPQRAILDGLAWQLHPL